MVEARAGLSTRTARAAQAVVPRSARALAVLGTAVAASVIAWLRLEPAARATLWADDARVFVQRALAVPAGQDLLEPYDGYLHLVPRALAQLAVATSPPAGLALVVTALACAVAGAVAGGVLVLTRDLVASPGVRVALALATVLVPLAPLEVSGNLANVHWYLLWLTPFLLLRTSTTRTGLVVRTVVLLVVALSEVQAVVFLVVPVVLALLRRLPRREVVPVVGLAVGIAAQALTVLTSARAVNEQPLPTPVQVVLGVLAEPVLGTWVPSSSVAGRLLDVGGWGVAVLAGVPVLAAAVLAWRAGGAGRRSLLVVALAAPVVLWTLDVVVNPSELTKFSFSDPGRLADVGFARYAVVPSLFVVTVLLLGVDALLARGRRATAVVVSVVLAAGLLWHVHQPHVLRATGPSWSAGLERARGACAAGAEVVDVPAVPAGWGTTVDCDIVLAPQRPS